MGLNITELQEEFARHFDRQDVEGAKKWINRWATDEPLYYKFEATERAMSGHVSDYLEGLTGLEPTSYNKSIKLYWDTKYGPDMVVDWEPQVHSASRGSVEVDLSLKIPSN